MVAALIKPKFEILKIKRTIFFAKAELKLKWFWPALIKAKLKATARFSHANVHHKKRG